MSAIPLEVLFPPVFFVRDCILPACLHGNVWSIMQSVHRHEYHLGLKVQLSFRREWVHEQERKHRSATFYMGTSHGTAQFTNPIVAQPKQPQSCENGCIKISSFCLAQSMTEIDQTRSEPHSAPQKDIGLLYMVASCLCIRMTRSIISMSLNTWGHMFRQRKKQCVSP